MTKRKGTATKRSVSTATAGTPAAPTPPSGGFDLKLLRDLARIANEYDLESVELRQDGGICITRVPASAQRMAPAQLSHSPLSMLPPAPAPSGPAPEAVKLVDDAIVITSPFVGTFYRAASQEASAFVEVGQMVRKGQVVCIVEAMKLMNEIEAEADGKLIEVMVKNGGHVEYGQPLFRLEKL